VCVRLCQLVKESRETRGFKVPGIVGLKETEGVSVRLTVAGRTRGTRGRRRVITVEVGLYKSDKVKIFSVVISKKKKIFSVVQ
jgi:hypothetical protein